MTRPVISKGVIPTRLRARAAGPGLEVEPGDGETLRRLFDQAGVTAHQHAPSLAHGLVYLIDLEGDDTGDGADHGVRGPEDDDPVDEDEVDREGHRAGSGRQDDAPDASGREVILALLCREVLEHRVHSGVSRARWAVHPSTLEGERCRLERDGDTRQRATGQGAVRALLEVRQEPRIYPGPPGQLLGGQAELVATVGDPPGEVPSQRACAIRGRGRCHAPSVRPAGTLP